MTYALSIPPLGDINAYISAVNAIPMITDEREKVLLLELKRGSVAAAHEFVLAHLRLVVSVARDYANTSTISHADIIQEGNIGLMKAVKAFDPDRGVKFSAFAWYWIRAEIVEFVMRNWRLMKVATTKPQRKLFFHQTLLNSGTPAADVAAQLKIPVRDVEEMRRRLGSHDVSITAPYSRFDDAVTLEEIMPAPADTPEEAVIKADLARYQSTRLQAAIKRLDEREKEILKKRWLTEDDPVPLRVLASKWGVTPARVQQIEAKLLGKLRSKLERAK